MQSSPSASYQIFSLHLTPCGRLLCSDNCLGYCLSLGKIVEVGFLFDRSLEGCVFTCFQGGREKDISNSIVI